MSTEINNVSTSKEMKSSNESNYYSANENNNLNTLLNEVTQAVEMVNPKARAGKQVPRGVNRRAARAHEASIHTQQQW